MSNNPLMAHFRAPKVHQALPSAGRFLTKGFKTAMNGEVGIMPMTATDEIILKNPDALLNGDALERLFKSCVPGIEDPREISVPDMDVLLLAIKLASYGDNLEVGVTCPKCENEFTTETSIRGLLAGAREVNLDDCVVRVDDTLIINIKPYDFHSKTLLDLATFEESKSLEYLLSTELSDDEKQSKFNEAFARIAELNLELLSRCIVNVVSGETVVTEPQYILEYIKNAERSVIQKINEKLKGLADSGIPKTLHVQCIKEECQHEWETGMVFDASHFFA